MAVKGDRITSRIFIGATVGLWIAIIIIQYAPFIPLETKIVWITRLSLPLVVITGSTGVALFRNVIAGLITGLVSFLLIQRIIETVTEILTKPN